jgi:hypothetical protein
LSSTFQYGETIRFAATADGVVIARSGSDTISNGLFSGSSINLSNGDTVELTAVPAGYYVTGGTFGQAASKQVQVLSISGGTETDLVTSSQERLAMAFIATGRNVMLTAQVYWNVTAGSGAVDLYVAAVVTTSAGAIISSNQNVVSVNIAPLIGLGAGATLSATHVMTGLIPGTQYRLALNTFKGQPVGPIYPRGMSINGVNF